MSLSKEDLRALVPEILTAPRDYSHNSEHVWKNGWTGEYLTDHRVLRELNTSTVYEVTTHHFLVHKTQGAYYTKSYTSETKYKKFMCAGGPLHHQWITAVTAREEGYSAFNNAGSSPYSRVYLHKSLLPS